MTEIQIDITSLQIPQDSSLTNENESTKNENIIQIDDVLEDKNEIEIDLNSNSKDDSLIITDLRTDLIFENDKDLIISENKNESNGKSLLMMNVMDLWETAKSLLLVVYKNPIAAIKAFLKSPIFVSILFTLSGGLMNGVFIAFSQEHQRQWHRQHPNVKLKEFILSDILFDVLGIHHHIETGDLLLTFLIVFTFTRIILCKARFVIARRFFILLGAMFYIRFTCLYLTLYSDPSFNQSNVSLNPLFESVFIASGLHVSTVDKMFSGHTASVTLAGLTLLEYHGKYPLFDFKKYGIIFSILFKIGVISYCLLCFCVFAMSRIHYTADIVVGAMLATSVFYLYKHYAVFAQTRNNTFNKIVAWIEQDADDIPTITFVQQEPISTKTSNNENIIELEE